MRSVRVHATDKPWITAVVKTAISKRQRYLSKYSKESELFKSWRNKVQRLIKHCKRSFYDTKVKTLTDTNVTHWWKEAKNLSGVSCAGGQWYGANSLISPSQSRHYAKELTPSSAA